MRFADWHHLCPANSYATYLYNTINDLSAIFFENLLLMAAPPKRLQ
jgi:hypothetical protein